MPEIDQLAMSIDEAARRAGLGRDKIYTAVKEGKLEARKAGRRTLVTADALRRFIDNPPTLQLT